MILILGLLILVAAVVVAVAGVLGNLGHAHAMVHGFSALGYHMTGSTGALFLYGIVVGAVGMLGLSLLLAAARRTSRRAHAVRSDARQSRQVSAAAVEDRGSLVGQHDAARADAKADLLSNV